MDAAQALIQRPASPNFKRKAIPPHSYRASRQTETGDDEEDVECPHCGKHFSLQRKYRAPEHKGDVREEGEWWLLRSIAKGAGSEDDEISGIGGVAGPGDRKADPVVRVSFCFLVDLLVGRLLLTMVENSQTTAQNLKQRLQRAMQRMGTPTESGDEEGGKLEVIVEKDEKEEKNEPGEGKKRKMDEDDDGGGEEGRKRGKTGRDGADAEDKEEKEA